MKKIQLSTLVFSEHIKHGSDILLLHDLDLTSHKYIFILSLGSSKINNHFSVRTWTLTRSALYSWVSPLPISVQSQCLKIATLFCTLLQLHKKYIRGAPSWKFRVCPIFSQSESNFFFYYFVWILWDLILVAVSFLLFRCLCFCFLPIIEMLVFL